MTKALARIPSVPNEHRVLAVVIALGLVLAAAAFYAGLASHDRVLTRHVTEQLGTPDSSVPPTGLNVEAMAGAGLVCDIFQAKLEVRCHR